MQSEVKRAQLHVAFAFGRFQGQEGRLLAQGVISELFGPQVGVGKARFQLRDVLIPLRDFLLQVFVLLVQELGLLLKQLDLLLELDFLHLQVLHVFLHAEKRSLQL